MRSGRWCVLTVLVNGLRAMGGGSEGTGIEVTLRIGVLEVTEEAGPGGAAGASTAARAGCDTFRLVEPPIVDYGNLRLRVDRGVFEQGPARPAPRTAAMSSEGPRRQS